MSQMSKEQAAKAAARARAKQEPVVVLRPLVFGGDRYEPGTDKPRILFLPAAAAGALCGAADPCVRRPNDNELLDLYANGKIDRHKALPALKRKQKADRAALMNAAAEAEREAARAAEKASKPEPAPAPAPEEKPLSEPPTPSDGHSLLSDLELVEQALQLGKRDILVKALVRVGLAPGDYSNNEKRKGALRAWLTGEG
jgi:hypothetical protein